jgi:hypothetical protein
MATGASDIRTGFGPGASVRIPVFDGKRQNFQIFELCLKTASMSMGLDALLLRPVRRANLASSSANSITYGCKNLIRVRVRVPDKG